LLSAGGGEALAQLPRVNGVRESTPFVENVRSDGSDAQYVIRQDRDEQPLDVGTEYAFQVQALRIFSTRSP
jgi:hypothetical protein